MRTSSHRFQLNAKHLDGGSGGAGVGRDDPERVTNGAQEAKSIAGDTKAL